jgi:hypothetical protein
MKQNDQGQQPFFAQFLTSQRNSAVQHNITPPGKDDLLTLKYPSDRDEDPLSALPE